MTLQQLRYIVALDEYQHFGKAAEACGLTQSTLSLMIKKLEEELDVQLFDRDAHPLVPTEMGRRILAQARVVLYNTDQIPALIRNEKQSLAGELRIGLISTVAPVLVPGLFRHFCHHHPAISLLTEEMLTENVKDKLHKAEIDIGILSTPVGDPQLLEIPLYTERFYAYVSKSDPAYAQESLRLDYTLSRPLWIMHNGLQLHDFSGWKDGGKPPVYEEYFEGGRVGTLIQIVEDNGGMTIVPETHIHLILHELHSRLRPITDPAPRRTIVLAIRRDYIHEAMLNAVIRGVKDIIPGTMLENIIRADYIKL